MLLHLEEWGAPHLKAHLCKTKTKPSHSQQDQNKGNAQISFSILKYHLLEIKVTAKQS